ncbi:MULTISPECIES: LysR family transcriptional regulator [unclassified Neorhizobium]|uniref:LysR family transcriptional regulator n=1 Tax=unclassified Neorhizobium TaxID=2629175 RepID=UPI001FF563CA|nr:MULTISPECIES: LysR family transcriptional regulator [unclassified Neorhizobium]MCJ9671599.1 LysR family transcriptional regulator [Neorhizobium sp. SHOUNA12B]MCJ9747728.1 LysR family transcriptional regulator [Neorhizobium sp. SHOUNA12A]
MARHEGSDADPSFNLEKIKVITTSEGKLTGIDLNLLVVLDALLQCRNVTHAARRLGQTQPAVSRALARLRELLKDDLLVRSSTGLKLTSRGQQLLQTVPDTLTQVREVISSRQTDRGTRLSINAALTPALLPYLLQSSARENAPFKINTHKSADEGMAQLRAHAVDYLLGTVFLEKPDLESELVFTEEFITLVSFERQQFGGVRLTEQAFLDLTHVHLVENGAEAFPQVVDTLMTYGRRRVQLFEVQDIMSAALMASEGMLALTVPRSIAGWLMRTLRLSAHLPPMAIPPHQVSMYWLAGVPDMSRRRVIADIDAAAKMVVAQDQGYVRVLRAIPGRE